MIVLDIECSGVYPEKNGICEIGALDLNNPENTFREICRIDDDEETNPQSLKVIGLTEEQLRDPKKQSQKQMLEKFLSWTEKIDMKNIMCQNPYFDLGFIAQKARKHGLKINLKYRSFDLHTIAAYKYYQIHKKFLISPTSKSSGMDLSTIMEFCGLEDKRISIDSKTNQVKKQGNPHGAMEDTKIHAECFSRIVFGKNLLKEYSDIPIPNYLSDK